MPDRSLQPGWSSAASTTTVFVGGPIQYAVAPDGRFDGRLRAMIDEIIDELAHSGAEVLSAHRIERFGAVAVGESAGIARRDFEWMRRCDVFVGVLPAASGRPYRSDGTCVELGWASAMSKPIVLLATPGVQYSHLVAGLDAVTSVTRLTLGDGGSADDVVDAVRRAAPAREIDVPLTDGASATLAIRGGVPARPAPVAPRLEVSAHTRRRVAALLDRGEFSAWYGGPIAREFEHEFARFHGELHAVAVNSGTSALHLAFAAAGLRPGDEVIIPIAAYVSAASAAVQVGAVPVACDVDPRTLTLSPGALERRINERTRAIVPVHFWGCPTDMAAVMGIARRHDLVVIEDCGQSHGARIGDRRVGAFGDFSCFSFAPRKHVSTGQGGMVMTPSADDAATLRALANKGKGDGWLDYRTLGFSYVMTEFEALVGLDALVRLDDEIADRRAAVARYRQVLAGCGLELPEEPDWGEHVYFKLPLTLPPGRADDLPFVVDAIAAENVSCRPTHPPLTRIGWLHDLMLAHGVDCSDALFPVGLGVLPRIFEVETGPSLPPEHAVVSARAILKVYNDINAAAGSAVAAS